MIDRDAVIARAVLGHQKLSTWLLDRFNQWFCSGGGVWQTALVTATIVFLEASGALNDPHGFWLLYWLTVYSAVTQPALAHSGRVSAEHVEMLLDRIEALEERILTAVDK